MLNCHEDTKCNVGGVNDGSAGIGPQRRVGHGAQLPYDRRRSKHVSYSPQKVMCGHALRGGLAGIGNVAVSGFRARVGRFVLGNGAEAAAGRSAVYVLCFFLCASEFGKVVLVKALGKLLHAARAKLEVSEAVAAQTQSQNGCVLFAVSALLRQLPQFASVLLEKGHAQGGVAVICISALQWL